MPVEIIQFLLKLLLKQNSCCVPQFPLIASCYKIVDSQTSFKLCEGVRNFGKVRVGVRVRTFWKQGVEDGKFLPPTLQLWEAE